MCQKHQNHNFHRIGSFKSLIGHKMVEEGLEKSNKNTQNRQRKLRKQPDSKNNLVLENKNVKRKINHSRKQSKREDTLRQ